MDQNSRLDFLKRKNAGLRIRLGFQERLSLPLSVAPFEVCLLDLERSDVVRERSSKIFPPRNSIEFISMSHYCRQFKINIPTVAKRLILAVDGEVLVVFPESDLVGVLCLSLDEFNSKWIALLREFPDGFVVVDAAFRNKAVIQIETSKGGGESVCDIATWGTIWCVDDVAGII